MTRPHITILLTAGAIALLLLSLFAGHSAFSAGEAARGLIGTGDAAGRLIVWDIRLPRAVAAFGTGAALGLAGAGLQGLLQNPLAEPGVLGVSSAASLGAIFTLYFGLAVPGSFVVMLAAILFALGAMTLLLMFGAGQTTSLQLILTGLGLSSLSGALISLAFNLAPNPYSLADLINWTLGSVTNRSWRDLIFVAPVWAIGAGVLLSAGSGLKALTLGEMTALSLGADPARTRTRAIIGVALLTGASVALAGAIGFIGLIAPHLVRRFVSNDPQAALIPSALAGGALLLVADIIIRSGLVPDGVKLGVMVALIGAPLFVWIAARSGSVAR